MNCRRFALICALNASSALLCMQSVFADDQVSVTPYRPSVSTPAQLSAPGWLEGEFGVQRANAWDADQGRRTSLPYTFKYAITPDWGVRVGGEARVHEHDENGDAITGGGDTSIVVKRRFAVNADGDDASAFGLEFGVNLPTAKSGLGSGSGKTDYSINGIYSADLGAWHTDVNLIGTRLGQVDVDQSHWQTAWAASLSHPLDERWGLTGELSGTWQRGAATAAQFLAAFSYAYSRKISFDFGAAHGLNHATAHVTAFAGVTVLMAKMADQPAH